MQQAIGEDIIDDIRAQTDLVALVEEYIKLERRGKNMVGLCPFHQEKTPSFSVSPEKQLYHCFGCGASGNVFNLVMELEKLTFPEAAKLLARRAGIRIPEKKLSSRPEDSLKENVYNLNLIAARYFQYNLLKTSAGKKAFKYLRSRGFTDETINLFMLGFATSSWTGLYDFAHRNGVSSDLMVKAGLVSQGKDNRYYDRFRNRIIFPIFTIGNRVAGFGGRQFSSQEHEGPKYLNSPETPVYRKGSILYGLNLARDEIRREKKAIVVEGYTDVITASQAGIKNVVASLGTALTNEQGKLLRSQAETVITAYDSDSAGEAATWRGLVVLQAAGCLVHVAELPEGGDPDSLIREKGAEEFNKRVEQSVPLIEYRLVKLRERYDLNTDQGRVKFIDELMPFLLTAINRVEQDYYLKMAAESLGVEEVTLRDELKKYRGRKNAYRAESVEKSPAAAEVQPLRKAEKILISLMLQSKEIAELGRNLIEDDFLDSPDVKAIFKEIWKMYQESEITTAERIIDRFDKESGLGKVISLAVTDPSLQDLQPPIAKRMAEDSIEYIKQVWMTRKQMELKKRIKELEASGASDEIEALLREHQELIKNKYGSPGRTGKGGDFNG